MKRTTVFILILIAAVVSSSVVAQRYSCSQLDWPEQVASIYEHIEPACVETLEIEGVRYGRFKGTFLSERAGEVTMRFVMPEGNSVVQTFKPPEDFRVRVDGKPTAFHQLQRGQDVSLLIAEPD